MGDSDIVGKDAQGKLGLAEVYSGNDPIVRDKKIGRLRMGYHEVFFAVASLH